LELLELTGSVMTVRDPREGVPFNLSDDFRGSPDFFLGNGDMRAAAFSRGGEWVSSLKSVTKETTLEEMRREVRDEASRLGIQGGVAAEELRERCRSLIEEHPLVTNTVEGIAEKFGHVKVGQRLEEGSYMQAAQALINRNRKRPMMKRTSSF
jgi:hypothetical protein